MEAIWRSMRRRCPRCGAGGLFSSWFSMRLSCPTCQLDFERHPGSFIGGVGLNTVVSFLALIAAIIAAFVVIGEDGTRTQLVLGPLVVAAVVPLVFYPFSKIIWVGIEYVIAPPDDPPEGGPTAGPDSPA